MRRGRAPRERVLVVDDEPELAGLTRIMLETAGLSVIYAANAAECLRVLEHEEPDLILLDINLPDLCGFDLCHKIKANPRTVGLPVVHLSGHHISSEEQALGLNAGADGYITRPISQYELIARVEAMLRVRRTESELRKVTDQLRKTSRALQQMMDYSLDAICSIDVGGHFVEVSAAAERMWGYSHAELIGRRCLELVHPADAQKSAAMFETIRKGHKTRDFENRFIHKDGGVVVLMWSACWSELDQKMFCVARDVTEGRITERALQRMGARLQSTLESMSDAFYLLDREFCLTYLNREAERLLNRPREEILHQCLWDSFPTAKDSELYKHYQRCFETNDPAHFEIYYQPHERWFEVNAFPSEEGLAVYFRDLTERHLALRAQRMESIGTLAGGIAHDLNNVLTPIIMSIDLLKLQASGTETHEIIHTIQVSANRGADMVRQVLSFAKGVDGERVPIQPRHLLKEIHKIVADTFPKTIDLKVVIEPGLWSVVGDPTQIQQVLLNLCVNARDAMPAGGRITIIVANELIDDTYAAAEVGARTGRHIRIDVEDTGCGIAAGAIQRIFDPFYTTKEFGHGSGLGLSTSLAIVKSHDGFIRVVSEVGRGTKFSVHLPAADEAVVTQVPTEIHHYPRGRGELILLVEDEIPVRTVTQRTLESFGYRVVVASDGAEAVAIYARQQAEIAVVMTDMMMPVMDGAATIAVLKRMNPDVKIIAASGTSNGGAFSRSEIPDARHVLPKPYSTGSILNALAETLDGLAH
jgi:PAS domain S-box-containing protein